MKIKKIEFNSIGSSETFIKLLNNNWESWISELETQEGCEKIKLKKGQYLSDVI